MYDQSKMWRNILLLIFVLLLLTHAVVWVRHADHASATAVSPQAVTVYGQGGSFTSGTVNTGGVSATSLNVPRTTALDSSGDLYVADYTNNRVLYYPAGSTTATRVYGQFGSFTTIVANNNGSGVSGTPSANSLNGPTGLALDSSGNLYIADDANNRMLYFTSGSTTATRVYGQNGSFTAVLINNTGGTANTISATSLYDPNDIALDSSNNLYVADYANNRVLYYASGSTTATRVYGQNGSFTTVLANNTGGTANITSATSLSYPTGLDLDNNGNLYIADFGNSRVLYYAAGSTTATRVYGQGGSFTVGTTNTGGTSATSFYKPFGVTIDSSGNLYVADSTNNRVLQFQTSLSITTQPPSSSPSQGTFSTVASLIDVGSGATFSDFTGTVSAAIKSGTGASGATLGGTISVSASSGVATFSSLYVNLIGSGYILTFSSPGVGSVNTTTTFAITNALGSQAVTVYGQSGSFTTNATTELSSPRNSVTDSSGDLYVADYTNNRVLYYPTGTTTFTSVHGQFGSLTTKVKDNNGSGIASSTPSSGNLYNPSDVALDSSGDLYIADTGNNRVLYYAAGSTTATRVYGQNGSFTTALVNNTGGTANTVSATSLSNPLSVALDSSGNLYVSDNGNNRVLYYASGSTTATRVYGQNGSFTTALVNNTGGTANTESATSLNQPFGVGLDSGNNLYVADNANYRVLYYASGSTTATRVYGQNGSFTSKLVNNTSGTANTVSATSLNSPSSVASDSANNLYIADTSNNRVLYYSSGSTTAIRVYGQAGSFTTNTVNNTSGTTGVVSANSLNSCYGINLDSHGDIYVADTSNNRMLEFQTALSITAQPPSIVATGTAFSTTATLIDVGSGATFPDFSGTVSTAIQAGSGTSGAVLSGTTSLAASSGTVTFSNLSINLTGASYTLTLSSSGANSGTTSAFGVLNPAGYWHFDEDSGTSAYDSSGNNNTGTLSATGVTWAAGKINAGLSFNGTKYVTMGTPSTLEFNNTSFSIVSWFNTTTTSTTRIAGSGLSTWNSGFSLGLNSSSCSTGCVAGDLGANGTQANTVLFETTTTFNDGNWHQAVMVIDETAKTAQIYVDGVAQPLSSAFCGTASGTTVNFSSCSLFNTYSTTEPFTVGSYKGTGGTGGYFTGSLDEIRVYGNALSSSQVQTLYTNDVNALSEYAANATFSGTVNSTATYTMPISLTYQLTPAPGWSLLITSTTLTSGTNTMPTTASSITSVAGACATTCTPTTLTNTISSFPMAIPAGTTAPTAVKFFGTAVGTGTGAYTVTPALSVIIPITTRTGTYTSTITLTAATGP